MKFVYPQINQVIEIGDGYVNSIVIEHQTLFHTLLEDLYCQMEGKRGYAVLSINNTPIEIAKFAEIISSFIPFDINRKPLLNKVITALEKTAVDESHYLTTQALLQQIENYIAQLSFDYRCNIVCAKATVATVLKAMGIEIRDDYFNLTEKIIDYMELVREFDRDKLFIFVNMRSYITDADMTKFIQTVLSHQFRVLFIEGSEKTKLPQEKRLIIDEDLCEF